MEIKKINSLFSVCKITDLSKVNFEDEYWFLSRTDEELSLVCQTKYVPEGYIECENDWRAFRIQGVLDFSLIGILSKISTILAENKIGIFAISTFNTDYILVKENQFELALVALEQSGYTIV